VFQVLRTPVRKTAEAHTLSRAIGEVLDVSQALDELRSLLVRGAGPEEMATEIGDVAEAIVQSLVERMLRTPVRKDDRAPSRSRVDVSFDLEPVEALEWARRRAAELVVEVDHSTREGIRAVIVEGLRDGKGTDDVAQRIRRSIGLHSSWALAVDRFYKRLIDEGIPPTKAEAQTAKYRERLISRRAEMIARTELLTATSQAHQAQWHKMARLGVFDGEPVREWTTARLDRPSKQGKVVCPICRPLNGVRVAGLDSTFASGKYRVVAPPIHVACRCRLVLVEEPPTPLSELPPTSA
jgi:hypothetical protein